MWASVVARVPGVEEGGELDGLGAAYPGGGSRAATGLSSSDWRSMTQRAWRASMRLRDHSMGSGGVVEDGPGFFVVGLDGGPVFGEGELDAE